MRMSQKYFEQIASAINQQINCQGNSKDVQDTLRTLANVFGDINPRFDRRRFFDAAGYNTTYAPHFYQSDLTSALRQYKKAHPEALMGDGIKALARMVEDAGGNPGEFIAFAAASPIDQAAERIAFYPPAS